MATVVVHTGKRLRYYWLSPCAAPNCLWCDVDDPKMRIDADVWEAYNRHCDADRWWQYILEALALNEGKEV